MKNMGNKDWEVDWEKVSEQHSLGWRWQRLFEDSLRSMEKNRNWRASKGLRVGRSVA